MAKKLTQKCKYLENEESFPDEVKNIFPQFQRAFIEANKTIFLEGECPIFNNYTIIMTNNSDKIRILSVWCFFLGCLFLS